MSGPDRGTCSSCGAPMLWGKHVMTGGKIPADPNVTATTGTRFQWNDALGGWETCTDDAVGYVSHFFTCPNAAHHRKSAQLALVQDDGTDG